MTLLRHLFQHVPQTDSNPSEPLIGHVEMPVNLELVPFVVSSSFGKPLLVTPVQQEADQTVVGTARFAFFTLEDEPLWPLLELVRKTGLEDDWPNYLRRDLDEVAVETARGHLDYSDLTLAHVVVHTDCKLEFGNATVLRSDDAPSDFAAFFAEPEFVGTVVTAGGNAGYIIHNLWRGVYVVDGT